MSQNVEKSAFKILCWKNPTVPGILDQGEYENSLKSFGSSQEEVQKVDQLDIRSHWQKVRRLQMFTDTKASVHQAMAS